eukprot:scaffold243996_cov40-Tisochrysis_lutea.AAC.4
MARQTFGRQGIRSSSILKICFLPSYYGGPSSWPRQPFSLPSSPREHTGYGSIIALCVSSLVAIAWHSQECLRHRTPL